MPKDKEKKEKKRIRWWGVLLIILGITVFVLPPAAAVALYFLLQDNSVAKYEHTPNAEVATVFKDAFVGAIDETGVETSPNHGKVHLRLTEHDLNDILDASLNSTLENSGASQYVSGYGVDITDNQYIFDVSGKFQNIFATRVRLYTTLKSDVKVDGEDAFVFAIRDAKIGHLSGLATIAKAFIPKELDPAEIERALASKGLHMTIDVKGLRIIYKMNDLFNDLEAIVGKALTSVSDPSLLPENFTLFYNILRRVYQDGHLSVLPNDNEGLSVDFDLSAFSPNEAPTYCVPTAQYDPHMAAVDYRSCIDYTEYLLANSYLDNEHDDVKNFLIYLAKGYMRNDGTTPGDDAANAAVDAMVTRHGGDDFLNDAHFGSGPFSSGIPSITGYKPTWYEDLYGTDGGKDADDPSIQPFTWTTEVNQAEVIANIALGNHQDYPMEARLDDATLSTRLRCTKFLGQSFAFPRKTAQGDWKVNAVYIDDFYCNFFSNKLVMNIGASVNGYETMLFMYADLEEAASQPADGRSFYFRLGEDAFHLGGSASGKELGDLLFTRVKSAVANNAAMGSYFSLQEVGEGENAIRRLVLDLDPSIDEMRDEAVLTTPDPYKDAVRDAYDSASFSLAVEGTSIADPDALLRFSGAIHI